MAQTHYRSQTSRDTLPAMIICICLVSLLCLWIALCVYVIGQELSTATWFETATTTVDALRARPPRVAVVYVSSCSPKEQHRLVASISALHNNYLRCQATVGTLKHTIHVLNPPNCSLNASAVTSLQGAGVDTGAIVHHEIVRWPAVSRQAYALYPKGMVESWHTASIDARVESFLFATVYRHVPSFLAAIRNTSSNYQYVMSVHRSMLLKKHVVKDFLSVVALYDLSYLTTSVGHTPLHTLPDLWRSAREFWLTRQFGYPRPRALVSRRDHDAVSGDALRLPPVPMANFTRIVANVCRFTRQVQQMFRQVGDHPDAQSYSDLMNRIAYSGSALDVRFEILKIADFLPPADDGVDVVDFWESSPSGVFTSAWAAPALRRFKVAQICAIHKAKTVRNPGLAVPNHIADLLNRKPSAWIRTEACPTMSTSMERDDYANFLVSPP